MKFQLEGETWDSIYPASLPYVFEQEVVQAVDKSASGVTHVESFNVQTDRMTVNFDNMEHPVYEALVNWFITTSNGAEKTFTVTDDLGNVFTARFTSSKLKFQNTGVGANNVPLWSGSFKLEAVQ